MSKSSLILLSLAVVLIADTAHADFCSYRPSQLLGGNATTAVGVGAAGAATAGAAAQIAGYYTLTHAVTGATMLGSTAAGTSAAGTVGIVAGTGAGIGAAVGALMSPFVIVGGIVIAVGVGAYEGGCYFQDERITDYSEVLLEMRKLHEASDKKAFRLVAPANEPGEARIVLTDLFGNTQTYYVKKLFIVNNVLKHDDWGRNTVIGNIGFVATEDPDGSEVEPDEARVYPADAATGDARGQVGNGLD